MRFVGGAENTALRQHNRDETGEDVQVEVEGCSDR